MKHDFTDAMRKEQVDLAVARLMECFDCVQILASYCDNDSATHSVARGRGNFYARTGMAREFLLNDSANLIGDSVSDAVSAPDDDSDAEAWKHA